MKVWIDGKEVEMKKHKIVGEVFAVEATRGQAGRSGHLYQSYSPDMKGQDDEGYVVINAIGNKQWISKEEFEDLEGKR